MKLRHLRPWAKARIRSIRRGTPQEIQEGARLKREARAHTVTDLQGHVRLLQQEITDLTAEVEQGGGPDTLRAKHKKLAELEAHLAKTQAELARYQGRI